MLSLLIENGEGNVDTMANVEYIIGEVFMNENLPNRYEMIAVFSTEKAIK